MLSLKIEKSDLPPAIRVNHIYQITCMEPLFDVYVPDLNPEIPLAYIIKSTMFDISPPYDTKRSLISRLITRYDLRFQEEGSDPLNWSKKDLLDYRASVLGYFHLAQWDTPETEEYFMNLAQKSFQAYEDGRVLWPEISKEPGWIPLCENAINNLKELIETHKKSKSAKP